MLITKKKLIISLGICALLLIAFLLFFSPMSAPGSLPDPKTLPKADCSDVGNTITVSMDEILSQETGDVVFAYVYNGRDDTGLLAVFTHYENEKPSAMLTVYEPDWSGIGSLIPAFEAGFEAKILDRAIVSSEESYRLYMASYQLSKTTGLKEEEIIPANAENAGDGMYWYFGHVSKQQNDRKAFLMQSGKYISMVGNAENAAGETVSTSIENLKQTAQRFNLEAFFGK